MVSFKNSRSQPIKTRHTDIHKACECVGFIGDNVFGWFHNKKSAWSVEQLPTTCAFSIQLTVGSRAKKLPISNLDFGVPADYKYFARIY